LGRYSVLARLASGGMATVYVGRQTGAAGFERLVAIKCCHEHLRLNESFVSMFLQEARLAARIRHPNVVATLDVSHGVPLYLVMEYVEGLSLSALSRRAAARGQRLPIDVTLRVLSDALAGLEAAHVCRGPDGQPLDLVHCDVSPQNILVGVDGTSRITDFGIARAAAQVAGEDEQGIIKGKLRYMTPEQLFSRPLAPRTDLFAAGIVLWEALTGQPLFRGDSDRATIHAILSKPIPAPSTLRPEAPKELDEVVLHALERHPSARFQTAEEFLAALDKVPVAVANARTVGEFVREHGGAMAVEWESGSFRSRTPLPPGGPVQPSLPAPAMEIEIPVDEPGGDAATRAFDPPADLVAAASPERDPERDPERGQGRFDVARARRVIVAVVLLLLGCAVGLMAATSAQPPAGEPQGAGTERAPKP
ncbi:MAG TPA: serine/threonine-protein kinase, partial [Polyangiaceae bacterium]|nr:serine/threonine-protein kinase [Polyangiaceae bacterium]